MFDRVLNLSKSRSFFLFGARGTGKSTLLRKYFGDQALWIDLLDPETERRYFQQPSLLEAAVSEFRQRDSQSVPWVVIDEIQKNPALLNEVHRLIRGRRAHFALTGSSARKLKRGHADLLAGRASWFELFPLTHRELGERFDLERTLRWGSLPEPVLLEEIERTRFLRSYCMVYLKEEILAEQLVRKAEPFRNFLELAAVQSGQILNYSKFAADCGVDTVTVQGYFEILVDTLIGLELQPFHLSVRKRQRKNPKFYFFDLGVTRALAGTIDDPVRSGTGAYGRLFEQFVILELWREVRYMEKDWKFSYLTTKDDAEIDLIIDQGSKKRWAIEIKSSERVDESEVGKFEKLAGDVPGATLLYLSRDPIPRKIGTVNCLPWWQGIERVTGG